MRAILKVKRELCPAKETYREALLGCHDEEFLVRRTTRADSSTDGILDSAGAGVQECGNQG